MYLSSRKKSPNKFLGLNTIASNYGKGGATFVRDVLGFDDFIKSRPKIPPPIEVQAIVLNQTTPEPEQIENVLLQNLGDTIDQVSENIGVLETELHDAGVRTALEQKDVGVENDTQLLLSLRDLERAHQFIGTMSGRIKASAAKISVLNDQITQLTRERDKLAFLREDIEDGRIEEIKKKIKDLREQRDLQTEHFNRDLSPSVKSQFARKKETVNTMLHFDRALGEKIQTLFREQGITIASVITAIGIVISTIATSIALGIKAATPNPKPKPSPKPKTKPGANPVWQE